MKFSTYFRQRPRRSRGLHKAHRHGWRERVAELLWPSMGWRAFARYLVLQVLRLADNPHRVALGVAIGIWVSWTPLLGFHNLIIILLCWTLGASILAGLAGAFVGNPWTLPLMWWSAYELGQTILGLQHVKVLQVLEGMTFHHLWVHLWPLLKLVFLPTMVGASILGLASGALCYWLTLGLMRAYSAARARRRMERHGR